MRSPTLKEVPTELQLRIIEAMPTKKAASLIDNHCGNFDKLAAAVGTEHAVKLAVIFYQDLNRSYAAPCIPKPNQDSRVKNKILNHFGQDLGHKVIDGLEAAYANQMNIFMPVADALFESAGAEEIQAMLLKDWKDYTKNRGIQKRKSCRRHMERGRTPLIGWAYHKAQEFNMPRADLMNFIRYECGIY